MDVTPLYTALHGPASATPTSLSGELQAENRQLIQAVHAANAAELFGENSELTFTLDRASGKVVIRLVDRKNRKETRRISADELFSLIECAGSADSAMEG